MSGDVIRLVPVAEVIADWAYYEPLIRKVMERADSGHVPDDVLTCVQFGTMQIWRIIGDQGMAVTEIIPFTRYRLFLVYMVAGENAQDWIAKGQQQLEAFAKSQNCTRMEFQGRPGWQRYCSKLGYTDTYVRMRKEI